MVGNEHEIPALKQGIQAAGGVGDEQVLHPQGRQEPHRHGHLGQGVALIGVNPPLEDQDGPVGQRAPAQPPLMGGAGGPGKVGQVLIGKGPPADQFAGQKLLPGAHDDAPLGLHIKPVHNVPGALCHLAGIGFNHDLSFPGDHGHLVGLPDAVALVKMPQQHCNIMTFPGYVNVTGLEKLCLILLDSLPSED